MIGCKDLASLFQNAQQSPPDPILSLTTLYNEDTFSKKVSLGVGAYRDENGNPWILPVVAKAEQILVNRPGRNHEYLPVPGLSSFTSSAARLIFGKDSEAIKENRVSSNQSISGTGSLYMGAMFLKRNYPLSNNIYLSDPTWANHKDVFGSLDFDLQKYPYWDSASKSIDFVGMLNSIKDAPDRSIFIFHACAHNPTGADLTADQWKAVANEFKKKNHFPYFDCAYQGFATGDLDNDAYAIRLFVSMGFEMMVSQSFAKNLGLYGERCGCLHVICNNSDASAKSSNSLQKIARTVFSSAPRYGADIASIILNDKELYEEWKQNLKTMSSRIFEMRTALRDRIVALGTPGNWDHIVKQIGMFSFTGLSPAQVNILIKKYHIYLTENGRISIAGLNYQNIDYVASAINAVVVSAQNSNL
ncbi:hypothetical protein BB559_000377 [Furculomyces boomerangus]|uniref:aspartate transaminase n=2 Tax=Harpellales TaxID=61421 RepID=A0A2T9Z5C9_9FUNG|nr:hypothetical protein BB559_000377 [Furculomyces boomerangus]PVZ99919.1 hypothetical protein BB558_004047 [Smittium angustum]